MGQILNRAVIYIHTYNITLTIYGNTSTQTFALYGMVHLPTFGFFRAANANSLNLTFSVITEDQGIYHCIVGYSDGNVVSQC